MLATQVTFEQAHQQETFMLSAKQFAESAKALDDELRKYNKYIQKHGKATADVERQVKVLLQALTNSDILSL